MAGVGESLELKLPSSESFSIFIRDPSVVSWDGKSILAKAHGVTEVYATTQKQMLILPVEVSGGKPLEDLQVVATSLSLTALSGSQDAIFQPGERLAGDLKVMVETKDGVRVAASEQTSSSFALVGETQTKSLTLQLVDERSRLELNEIYPLKGVRVSIVSDPTVYESDARGLVEIAGLPQGSRLQLRIDDPSGQIPVHQYEIYITREDAPQSELLKVMTYRSFFLYSQIFQLAQQSELASLCLDLRSRDGALALDAVSATINSEADGPFYFNQFGPDPQASQTDKSGRVCWFNVDPGLREISFYSQGEYLSSVAIALAPGSHLDDRVYLWNGPQRELKLAAMPTALEQLYSDFDRYQPLKEIDFVEMLAVGDNEPLASLDTGLLGVEAGYSWYRGRLYFLAEAAEFESVILSLDYDSFQTTGGTPVAPLLPRGFVEDLYHELYLAQSQLVEAYDPAMASLLVLHGQSEQDEFVDVQLFDSSGQEVKKSWNFGSSQDGMQKAIFFNLEPGVYSVKVLSQEGEWLDFDTVALDYWTTSIVQTGQTIGSFSKASS